MSDFFNEVEEDLRAERWRELWKKYARVVIGVAALIVLGVLGFWGYSAWHSRRVAAASESFDHGLKALQSHNVAQAQADFAKTAKGGTAAYKALALMAEAGLALNQNQSDRALKLLDEAAGAVHDPMLSDVARLKAAYLVMDKSPFSYADVQKRLDPLMKDGRPYRNYAREALAFAKLQAGRPADARGDFVLISLAQGVSDEMRARAQRGISMVDAGEAKQLPAIANAAAQPGGVFNPFASQVGSPAPHAGAAPR